MINLQMTRFLPAFVLVATTLGAEKQIKLEDIEKDNLRSDEQTKLEKHYQQYQTQIPGGLQYPGLQYQAAAYQQSPVAYQQAALAYQQQPHAYQQSPAYQQYILPQQYLQQSLYQGNYPQIGNNAIGAGPVHPFQSYFSQQIQPVATAPAGSPSQQHGLVMAYSSPSMAAFQQQAAAYYQGLTNQQQPYVSSAPASHIPPFYYQQYQQQPASGPAAPITSAGAPQSTPLVYNPQQYVPPFQSIGSSSRLAVPSDQQYSLSSSSSNFPGPFATPSYSSQSAYVTPSPYSSNQIYSQTAEPPAFQPLKSSPHSAASFGQQQQYLQSLASTVSPIQQNSQQSQQYASTVSPLQSKFLNSPQYLSQNYNTISNSYSGPKSTVSGAKPSLKIATQGGFLPNNPNTNYQSYRSISG